MPARLHAQTVARTLAAVALLAVAWLRVGASARQGEVTDADLDRLDGGRIVVVGTPGGDRGLSRVPLEVYVARVLAGEAELNAPEGELEALAIAIRTYATFNAGRHARDGFDLCDTTHCQVMRAATAATRRAALATAGQVLTWRGAPAEIFYSASCGGRSESAAAVWPGADLPYLTSVEDDVHQEDVPWTYDLPLRDLQRLLGQRGFGGQRLRDVRIASHTSSGRVGTLRLVGLEPDVIAGDQFRLLVGARDIRSTAFTVDRRGDGLHFTGRGYGHGVGMCVIGAGRRARRGESVARILAQYYPGLDVQSLDTLATRFVSNAAGPAARGRISAPPPAGTPAAPAGLVPAASARPGAPPLIVRSRTDTSDLQVEALAARDAIVKALGVAAPAVTIDVHETVEGFRQATGKPWWVSVSVAGTDVDLAPLPLLEQRDGVEMTLRNALVQVIVMPEFRGRPAWVPVGAGRFFSRPSAQALPAHAKVKCPADAELTLAVSAAAQRDAESRAEACFARAYAAAGNWRSVR